MNAEPGAARVGNFINYYQFNPPDNRLELLPKDLAIAAGIEKGIGQTLLCLDIGCNSGVSKAST